MTSKIAKIKNSTKIKEAILETAISIAKKDGWEAVSTRKVSQMINYSTTAIYHYFGNKEALLLEIQRSGFLSLQKKLSDSINSFQGDIDKQILEASLEKWKFAMENKALYILMFSHEGSGFTGRPAEEVNNSGLAVIQLFNKKLKKDQMSYFTNWWALTHGFIAIAITSHLGPDNDILFRYYKQSVIRLINEINSNLINKI